MPTPHHHRDVSRDLHQRTLMVATMGPATESPGVVQQLIRYGVDIFRVNASHGSPEEHARRIGLVRQLSRSLSKRTSVLIDLPGPKLRLGDVRRGSMELKLGEVVRLVGPSEKKRGRTLTLRQPDILRQLKSRQAVFLADGTVQLEVLRAFPRAVTCRVVAAGLVRSGSGLNLPETDLHVRLPTPADERWIAFAARHDVEWLGISFVQIPAEVDAVRSEAARNRYKPKLMAKIEKRKALRNLRKIIRRADGVMVARGDLGVETPLEEIAFVQKRIIAEANRQKKPVVTATQMLESMVSRPTPTRAEVTDIANAVLDGTDGVMLSAETAIGKYPVQAVEVLGRVVSAAEKAVRRKPTALYSADSSTQWVVVR